ncbi:MAG: aminoacyl-tRNA hydrolase [Lachnospiraceae bacterium]|nr:aminoacyl-tRNA hydrolase [Lachnospiraceae bacterium]
MAFLVAGLGNPEKKYEGSRHNAGFEALDDLADKYNIALTRVQKKAVTGTGMIDGQKVMLIKPLTYMNASGEAIRALCDYYRIDAARQLIVLVDDIYLPVARIRIRKGGSDGGHNGLKNIIRHLGHENFVRIRIGVGSTEVGGDLIPHVLGPVPKELRASYEESLARAAAAAAMIVTDGADKAMNTFNAKQEQD